MKINVKKLVIASLMLALAMLLPQIFGRIQALGSKFLPMHIPVLLCGFICGVRLGGLCGALAPLLCSLIFGMPPMYPMAFAMAFELAAYGALSGFLYRLLPKKKINVYVSLLISMVGGRIVWGLAQLCLMGFNFEKFTFAVFFSGAVINAIPGIILQILLIPIIIVILEKSKIIEKLR